MRFTEQDLRVVDFRMDPRDKRPSPALTYPLEWEYRVIGSDETALRSAIARVLGARSHNVVSSKKSPEGRWISVHVELVVATEVERDQLHRDLVAEPAVQYVM